MGKEIYRLYARPSFLEGVARLFDLRGSLNKYNYSRSITEADFRSIESDWQFVGNDLRAAIKQFAQENNLEENSND